jgi:hypothetical protein
MGIRPDGSKQAGATDHKTADDDPHTHEEDKQALHTRRGKLSIPKRGENPALTELKNRKRGKKG